MPEVLIERLPEDKVELKIEVEKEKVNQSLDKAYRKIAKEVKISGFRPGKVPRHILEKHLGEGVLAQEVIEMLIPETYWQAVVDNKLEVISAPEFTEIGKVVKDLPFKFKAKVSLKPQVELGEYKGIEIEKEEINITEEKVQNHIEFLQKIKAKLIPKESGTIEKGDIVTIKFKGEVEGLSITKGEEQKIQCEIGSGNFLLPLEEKLIGLKNNEEKEIEVVLPTDFPDKELKGKRAKFAVKIMDIKLKQLPEIEELVKELKYPSYEKLKEEVKNRLKAEAELKQKRELEEKLLKKICANAKVNLPEVLVQQEKDLLLNRLRENLKMQGLSPEEYIKDGVLIDEKKEEELKSAAERKVKESLVLEAVAKSEKIEVSEEELDQYITNLSQKLGQDKDKVKDSLIKNGQIYQIKNEILTNKTLNFLMENAKITPSNLPVSDEHTPKGEKDI